MSGRRSQTPERRGWTAQGRDSAPTPLPPSPPPLPLSPPALPDNPGSWEVRSRSVREWAGGRPVAGAGSSGSPLGPASPVFLPAPASLGGVPEEGISPEVGAGWVSSAGAVAGSFGLPLVSLGPISSSDFSVMGSFPSSPVGSDTQPPSLQDPQFAETQAESQPATLENPSGASSASGPLGFPVAPPSPEEIGGSAHNLGDRPICLEQLNREDRGASLPFEVGCCNNLLHLGCLASFGRNMSQFNCVFCRSNMHNLNWQTYYEVCAREGVPPIAEAVASDIGSTIRAARPDYVVRTFSGRDAAEPAMPSHILVTCCLRQFGGRETDGAPIDRRSLHADGTSYISRFEPHCLCPPCGQGYSDA